MKVVLFAFIAIILAWLPIKAVPRMLDSLRESRCRKNLNEIAAALALYQNQHGNQFPVYLAALYPKYVPGLDTFVCPVDRQDGVVSAQSEWMKKHDTGNPEEDMYTAYKSADLDGPTGELDQDEDRIRCSYLYALNVYENERYGIPWRELFVRVQEDHGLRVAEMPIIRCLHHLPPKPLPERNQFGELILQEFDESYEHPTYNVLYNLTVTELRERWLMGRD